MIIEFTGAPCCGKSAVSHKLAEMLRADGFSVEEPSYRSSHSASKIKRMLIKVVHAFSFAITRPLIAVSARRCGSPGWCLNYLYIRSFSGKKKICILDQGLCQCVASLFDDKSADGEKVDELFAALLPAEPDRCQAFIHAGADRITERMLKREDAPYYASTGNVTGAIANSINTNALLWEKWEEKYGSRFCITVSNDGDDCGDKAAEKLHNEIKVRGIL